MTTKTFDATSRAVTETSGVQGPALRVDPPHEASLQVRETLVENISSEQPLLEAEEPTETLIAAVMGENVAAEREHLQLQVAQLAAHLRERLREVDRREASLNARAGQLEADLRASRIWLQERELAFQDREQELQQRIAELEERPQAAISSSTQAQDEPSAVVADWEEREQQIRLLEDDVRERRFEVDRQASALRHAQQIWQQQREREERQLVVEREQMTRELNSETALREEQLRLADALLREHLKKLDADSQALTAERAAWDAQRQEKIEAIEILRAETEAECAELRVRLDARQEWIERQKGGLEQVRSEAIRLHRESLEMRLIAEQLWAQISGSLSPAEITQTVAQLRLKLAEQYRLDEQQLRQRKEDLLQVCEQITAQHHELEQLRAGLRDWANTRQVEIERQAATLVERELGLDALKDSFRRAEREWQAERRSYEQRIRDLTTQLRTLPVPA